jgi:dUTP pyrophosphatase
VALGGVVQVDHPWHAVNTVKAWKDAGVLAKNAARSSTDTIALAFTMDGGSESLLPIRHYRDDAALDLFVSRATTIAHQEFADVPAGCQVELPPGTWGLILGRSSTIRRRRVLVVPGVIDVGYRGDLFVGCYNVSGSTQTIAAGERVGQLIVMPNLTEHYQPVKVESLGDSERGTAGFGSTGGFNSNGGS